MKNKNNIVKDYINKQIDAQIYREGQLIPSESTLCQTLQVSRMTLRKALDELVSEGIIYKEKGRGTFVSRKPKYAEFRCGVGFSRETIKRGMIPSSKEATLTLMEADEKIAADLQIKPHDAVWKVTRVRCANEEPVIYAEEYYTHALCPDLTLRIVEESIYAHLEKKGICVGSLDQKMEAILCPEKIAKKMDLEVGHPLILMSSIVYMENGIAFNCGIEYYRSDKFTLVQTLYHPYD